MTNEYASPTGRHQLGTPEVSRLGERRRLPTMLRRRAVLYIPLSSPVMFPIKCPDQAPVAGAGRAIPRCTAGLAATRSCQALMCWCALKSTPMRRAM